jgi:type IV fimbrial biogenesis protein FimT
MPAHLSGRIGVHHLALLPRRAALYSAGFSLLELLVALAIVAATLISAPSLARLLAQHRVSTEINNLFTHVYLARSETLRRGVNVVLCRSSDGLNCSAEARWHDGWIVFEDRNDNKQRDEGESIIRAQQALHPHLQLRYGTTTDYRYLRYTPDGAASPNATFTLCDRSGRSVARAIIVYWSGRARVSDQNASGGALSCV